MNKLPGKIVKISQNQPASVDYLHAKLSKLINWDDDCGVWITISDLMRFFGMPTDKGSLIAANKAILKINPMTASRRSNGQRLILVPASIKSEANIPTNGNQNHQ